MNDEIKEILDWLKDEDIYLEDHGYQYKRISLKETMQLLDYITNLQQDNERLKDNRDWWKDRFFGQQEYDDSHRITAIEYKKRMDKAIEELKSWQLDCNYSKENEIYQYIINILQNGSEENE